MMTKEQERQALEQIKKILETLDEDGYVATAMRGVVEDAETNIQNDWALSRYDAWQDAEYLADKRKTELMEAQQEIDNMKEYIKSLEYVNEKAINEAMDATREVKIKTIDGDIYHGRFAEIKHYNNNGFRFINIVQESGWTTSYKLDDIDELIIK